MEDLLNTALTALKEKRPQLYEQLIPFAPEADAYPIEPDEGRCMTLKVCGRQLTSHHDRMGQAAFALEGHRPEEPLFIYGFGLGDEVRLALSRGFAQITVFILNPGLFYILLGLIDNLPGLFEDRRVDFRLPGDSGAVMPRPVIIVPELYLNPQRYNTLKTRLILLLDEAYGQRLYEQTREKRRQAALSNRQRLAELTPLTKDMLPRTQKALVLGAGPSLGDRIELVRQQIKEGVTLIACDTALAVLEQNGIAPHIAATNDLLIDRHAGVRFLKERALYKNSLLIFCVSSPLKIADLWQGRRAFTYSKADLEILPELPQAGADLIKGAGSVLLTCLDIAKVCGASEIGLLGADFAYQGQKSHSGTADNSFTGADSRLQVLCVDGTMQRTQRNFMLYREYTEQFIKANPGIRFINYSKTGAVIRGALAGA